MAKKQSMTAEQMESWRLTIVSQKEALKLHMLRNLEWVFRLRHKSAIMHNYMWQAVLEAPHRAEEHHVGKL